MPYRVNRIREANAEPRRGGLTLRRDIYIHGAISRRSAIATLAILKTGMEANASRLQHVMKAAQQPAHRCSVGLGDANSRSNAGQTVARHGVASEKHENG